MNLRRRHCLFPKVLNKSSLLNRLYFSVILHRMSFKHMLQLNENMFRLETWYITITYTKYLSDKKSARLLK
ncbi:hypothetical protein C0J52_06231 [Blattella germanica]|nr:hypothetical protein C0J52_06231 [Blattella germanica]